MKESVLDNGILELPEAGPANSLRTIFPPNKGCNVLHSESQWGQARKQVFNTKDSIHTVEIHLHPQNQERKALGQNTDEDVRQPECDLKLDESYESSEEEMKM